MCLCVCLARVSLLSIHVCGIYTLRKLRRSETIYLSADSQHRSSAANGCGKLLPLANTHTHTHSSDLSIACDNFPANLPPPTSGHFFAAVFCVALSHRIEFANKSRKVSRRAAVHPLLFRVSLPNDMHSAFFFIASRHTIRAALLTKKRALPAIKHRRVTARCQQRRPLW